MGKYGLLIEGYPVVEGDTLDDEQGKTKYTIVEINPNNIIIEWETSDNLVHRTSIPPSSWDSAVVINLEDYRDDPNLMFKLRRKS